MKIQDYINIVSTQNNINIATDESIDDKFNFYINKKIKGNVNIEVLQEVLKSHGYMLVKKSPSYFIVKKKDDILINKIKIYKIKYADTKKIKEKIQKVLKGYFKNIKKIKNSKGTKKFTPLDERKNNENNSNIKTTEIEEKINYSVENLDNKTLAVTYKDAFVPVVAESIIDNMDKKLTNIRVTLKISEVKTASLKEIGTQYDISLAYKNSNFNTKINPKSGSMENILKMGDYANSLNGVNIGATIDMLESKGKSKVVSEPSVLLYEGKSAHLNDGKTFPIKNNQTDTTNSSTTNTVTNYNDKSTGLSIDITFKEKRGKYLYLDLDLSINLVQDYNIDLQQITTIDRNLKNNLRVVPGQKITIAGLTNNVTSDDAGGIPYLQDIPYIGSLFKYKKNKDDETILIIELNTEIIDDI